MERKSARSCETTTPGNENGSRLNSTRMGGRSKDMLFAFGVLTVPMLIFSALLLGLIYHFRIVHNSFVSSNLRFNAGYDETANNEGVTPLHGAAGNGHAEVAKFPSRAGCGCESCEQQ
jgi:ankyrin repeat protein